VATKAPARRGRPRSLTIDRIIEGAIDIVESLGVKALTMHALSRELGVGTMTLYGYVESRDDLIDRTVAYLLAQAPPAPVRTSPDWVEAVVAHCLALRRWLIARPALFLLDAERPHLSDAAAATYAKELASFTRVGFSVEEAAIVRHAISTQLFGQIRWEEVRRAAERSGVLGRNRKRATEGEVPSLVAGAAKVISSMDPETLYEQSLRGLLAGFRRSKAGASR
jgi:AcrR family transcriptional regulator